MLTDAGCHVNAVHGRLERRCAFFTVEQARKLHKSFLEAYPKLAQFVAECRPLVRPDFSHMEIRLMAWCREHGLDMYGRDVRMKTFMVVVETKDEKGNVTAASELQTVVARDKKAAELQVVAVLAKDGKFEEGMEPTAVPFDSLVQGCKTR